MHHFSYWIIAKLKPSFGFLLNLYLKFATCIVVFFFMLILMNLETHYLALYCGRKDIVDHRTIGNRIWLTTLFYESTKAWELADRQPGLFILLFWPFVRHMSDVIVAARQALICSVVVKNVLRNTLGVFIGLLMDWDIKRLQDTTTSYATAHPSTSAKDRSTCKAIHVHQLVRTHALHSVNRLTAHFCFRSESSRPKWHHRVWWLNSGYLFLIFSHSGCITAQLFVYLVP